MGRAGLMLLVRFSHCPFCQRGTQGRSVPQGVPGQCCLQPAAPTPGWGSWCPLSRLSLGLWLVATWGILTCGRGGTAVCVSLGPVAEEGSWGRDWGPGPSPWTCLWYSCCRDLPAVPLRAQHVPPGRQLPSILQPHGQRGMALDGPLGCGSALPDAGVPVQPVPLWLRAAPCRDAVPASLDWRRPGRLVARGRQSCCRCLPAVPRGVGGFVLVLVSQPFAGAAGAEAGEQRRDSPLQPLLKQPPAFLTSTNCTNCANGACSAICHHL